MKKNILAIILVAVMFLTTGCSANDKYSKFKEVKEYDTKVLVGHTNCDSISHEFEKYEDSFPWNDIDRQKSLPNIEYEINGEKMVFYYWHTRFIDHCVSDYYYSQKNNGKSYTIGLNEKNGNLTYWEDNSVNNKLLECSDEERAKIEKDALLVSENIAKKYLPSENEYEITTEWKQIYDKYTDEYTGDEFLIYYTRNISSFTVSELTVCFNSDGELKSFDVVINGFADNVDIIIDEKMLQESIDSKIDDLFKNAGYASAEIIAGERVLLIFKNKIYVLARFTATIEGTDEYVNFPTVTVIGKL